MAGEDIRLTGFEFIERLGVGGMGVVWKARQLSLDRMVAIKLVRSDSIRSPEDAKQILQEARTAAKLKHPGIVQVYDVIEQDGHYFLVMEFVDGYATSKWLARRGQLPAKDVLVIAESVATALEYAWQAAELIHCDIKPENVMVDQDGTIKVADLGLSLTKDSKSSEPSNEITGTPSYMSPEQVRGDVHLDFRTDIYSLGAMMYELLTGVRPFHGKTDAEVMECQLSETIADPRDRVPGIPACVCLLLERMLVKDRVGRHTSWTKFLSDLRRVSKGMLPQGPAPVTGSSTVALRKTVAVVKEPEPASGLPARKRNKAVPVLFLLFLLAAALAGYRMWKGAVPGGETSRETGVPFVGEVFKSGGNESRVEEEAGQWLAKAREWSRAHPAGYDVAIKRFMRVKEMYPGTAAARTAIEEIEQLHLRKERDFQAAWESIRKRSDELVRGRDLKGALVFVEQYSGAFAPETESNRVALAQELRAKLGDLEVGRVEEEAWRGFVDRLADGVMAGKIQLAVDDVAAAVKSARFPRHGDMLGGVDKVLKEATTASLRVLESFRAEIGNVVPVRMGRVQMNVRITDVGDRKVNAAMISDGTQISFHPDDLPVEERLRRMGNPDSEGAALMKGVLAVNGLQFAMAEECFPRTGPVLSGPLMEKLKAVKSARSEEEVMMGLARVLRSGGIAVGAYDEAGWIRAVEQVRLTREQAAALNEQREKFLMESGMSGFAIKAAPVLLALERRCVMGMEGAPGGAAAPVVDSNVSRPQVSVESILAAFRQQNPGVQEESITVYPSNGGKGVKVVSDSVVNLSAFAEGGLIQGLWLEAVRAKDPGLDLKPLTKAGLKELRIKGYLPLDLSAFRGMTLRHLTLQGVNVMSLVGLEGLPLVELDLTASGVKELSPLHGMKLESLNLNGTKVGSLMPLAGMPLKTLNGRGIPVRDVSVLRGLPLETLDLSETPLMDFSVLRGLNLRVLALAKTSLKDIGICSVMPLESLDVGDTAITDISCLRGKNMRRLILARTAIKDIAPLAGSSIHTLDLSGTKTSFIMLPQVLSKVRFHEIALDNIELTRIDFLRGKELRRVSLAGTKVTDLSPLANMPIRLLNIRGLRIDDASAIGTLNMLEDLWCDLDPLQERVLLADLPSLRTINGINRRDERFERDGRAGRPRPR